MNSHNHESAERSFELERIVFFSDAVYAIAITLLAIELKAPELEIQDTAHLLGAVFAEWPRFMAFAFSFCIIGVYWLAHHRYFRYIKRYDERLIGVNLLMLFFIALMPFTTSVVGEYGFFAGGIWLYAVNMLFLGLSGALLWHHASDKHRLVDANLDVRLIRLLQMRALSVPAVAVIVIVLSVFIGGLASLSWFLIFPLQKWLGRRYKIKP